MTMKSIGNDVPNALALFSSLVLKNKRTENKVALNLTISLFKKYSHTNSSQKVLY